MSPDWFLSSELKVVDDSTLERLIAESANDNGTVTERLLHKSEPCWLAMWDAVLSSGVDAVDSVANLQHATTATTAILWVAGEDLTALLTQIRSYYCITFISDYFEEKKYI